MSETNDWIEEAQARCDAVPAGELKANFDPDGGGRVCRVENAQCVMCVGLMGDYDYEKEEWSEETIAEWRAYAALFAASRTDLPRALAMVVSEKERADKAEAELNRFVDLMAQATEELKALKWRGDLFRDERDKVAAVLYKNGCPSLNTSSPEALEWLDELLERGKQP